MRVAVAGGTGLVGRMVVGRLQELGHEPVPIARSTGADVTAGTGLSRALTGAEALVDVVNVDTLRRRTAVAFFSTAATHVIRAAAEAGVARYVLLSIVGVDRVPFGYYEGKLRQEEVVLAGPVPATVLRSTQFHEFAAFSLDRARGPVALVPDQLVQPVAAREAAAALVDLAVGSPRDGQQEIAGPEQHRLVDMARRVARARGSRRPIVRVRLPGAAGTAMATGGLLPTPGGLRGTTTFDAWLRAGDTSGGPG